MQLPRTWCWIARDASTLTVRAKTWRKTNLCVRSYTECLAFTHTELAANLKKSFGCLICEF